MYLLLRQLPSGSHLLHCIQQRPRYLCVFMRAHCVLSSRPADWNWVFPMGAMKNNDAPEAPQLSTCMHSYLQKFKENRGIMPRIIRSMDGHHIQQGRSTGQSCQSCSWSAEQGKCTFSCPRSRLRIWSRETVSALPSRISLLILRLNLVRTYGIPSPEFRGGVHLFMYSYSSLLAYCSFLDALRLLGV